MKTLCMAVAAAAMVSAAAPASAATTIYKLDVTVTSAAGARFSAPVFDEFNLSGAGVQIDNVRIFNGPPWDWNRVGGPDPYKIINPAGGTRILLEGQEATSDRNDGCTAGLKYGFTGFDPGESFHFTSDPESAGCGSAVVDVRPFLNSDTLAVAVAFKDGPTLTGNDWTLEYIDPQANHASDSNQRYRLTLQASVTAPSAAPEPDTWAMLIAGFGLAGAGLRRRRVAA